MPPVKKLSATEALAELTTRYFNSRGPATLQDFAVWSGLTNGQAKKGMAMVSSHFMQEKWKDDQYYFPETNLMDKKIFRKAWLLPPFDEYIMGYKNRDAIFLKEIK